MTGGVLRNAAHLKLDAGTLGALELHLRIRDGAVHLRVGGDAAHLVEAHAGELSRALAGEGLKLAPVEPTPPTSGGMGLRDGTANDGREQRRDAWDHAAESRDGGTVQVPSRTVANIPAAASGSRVDVKA